MTHRAVFKELLVLLLIFLGLEGGYRLYKLHRYGLMDYPDVMAVGYFQVDPRYGCVAKKDFRSETMIPEKVRRDPALRRFYGARFTTNHWGYRSPEFAIPKPDGCFRILVLGDSASMNLELNDEETWPARLQAQLQDDPHFRAMVHAQAIEVINGSNGAWRTREGLIRLREEGVRLQPDLVLIAFGWTDVSQGVEGVDPEVVDMPRRRWWNYVKVFENLWVRWDVYQSEDKGQQDFLRRHLRRDTPWAHTFSRNLVGMQKVASQVGAEAVLVNLPGLCRREALGTEEFQQVVEKTRVTAANYSLWMEVEEFVAGLLWDVGREAGMRVIDVSDHFRTFSDARRLALFMDEMHVTQAGARETATAVHQALAR